MSNLVNEIGKLKRDNTNFSLYDDNPELYDELGESGVKFVDSPRWLSWIHQDRPFVLGNTVISPKNYSGHDYFVGENAKDWGSDELLQYQNVMHEKDYSSWGEFIAKEETPHISQYRQKGLFGFLVDYGKELFQHGGQEAMYELSLIHI